MANLPEIRENRIKKLNKISSQGLNPYPQQQKELIGFQRFSSGFLN